ncbi:MAG: hypothetical protein ACXAD7_17150 [Candidatus Kariarchaeaceae archaeon]|jgi:hypothetical protein
MKDLDQKILENEYKRKKMFPNVKSKQEKQYLEKLRFHIKIHNEIDQSTFAKEKI